MIKKFGKKFKKVLAGVVMLPCMFLMFACNDTPSTPSEPSSPSNPSNPGESQQPETLTKDNYKDAFTALADTLTNVSFEITDNPEDLGFEEEGGTQGGQQGGDQGGGESGDQSENQGSGESGNQGTEQGETSQITSFKLKGNTLYLSTAESEIEKGYKVPNSEKDVATINSINEIANFVAKVFSSNKLNGKDLTKTLTYPVTMFGTTLNVTQKITYTRDAKNIKGSFTFTDGANTPSQQDEQAAPTENKIVSVFDITYNFADKKLEKYSLSTYHQFANEPEPTVNAISYEESKTEKLVVLDVDNKDAEVALAVQEIVTQITTSTETLVNEAKTIQENIATENPETSDAVEVIEDDFTEEYEEVKINRMDNDTLSNLIDQSYVVIDDLYNEYANKLGELQQSYPNFTITDPEGKDLINNNFGVTDSAYVPFKTLLKVNNMNNTSGAFAQTVGDMNELYQRPKQLFTAKNGGNYLFDFDTYLNRTMLINFNVTNEQSHKKTPTVKMTFENDGKYIIGRYAIINEKENDTSSLTVNYAVEAKLGYEFEGENTMPTLTSFSIKSYSINHYESEGSIVTEEKCMGFNYVKGATEDENEYGFLIEKDISGDKLNSLYSGALKTELENIKKDNSKIFDTQGAIKLKNTITTINVDPTKNANPAGV